MDPDVASLFVAALVVVYLIPGADMILVWQTGVAEGRSRALATAGGLAAARAVHVALAGLGLAALFHAVPWTFDLARWLGAAWLIRLGVEVWRSPAFDLAAPERARDRRSHGAAFLRGLATNLTNPKALIFCSMLLPQFVRPEAGAVEAQFAALGVVLVATGFAFDAAYAATGAGLARVLAGRPGLARFQRGLFAVLLVGFGLRLALPFAGGG